MQKDVGNREMYASKLCKDKGQCNKTVAISATNEHVEIKFDVKLFSVGAII